MSAGTAESGCMSNRVGIVGNGWVGKAMKELFPDAWVYVRQMPVTTDDLPHKYTTDRELFNRECDIAFICVPTPVIGEGKLDTSAVEECIVWLETPLIVIRSTVNPGDCDRWFSLYGKRIVFQPEYLGETPAHPLLDTSQTNFLIIGGHPGNRRELIELYQQVYNANTHIRQVTNYQAEVIKLTENRAIAFKVAQCQELYDVCSIDPKLDYYEIVQAVYNDDSRFNLWHTFVYPDKRGFNSKCIPKDVYAWCAWAESLGYEPRITRAMLDKNKEWISSQ